MSRFYFFLISVFLLSSIQSCNNENQDASTSAKKQFTSWQASSIPILNYDEFKPMLEAKDDETLYVFNFWATWCKPCVEELPYFEKLNEKYDHVEVTLVSLDFSNKLNELVVPFANKHKLTSNIILLDDTRSFYWIPDVDENWSGAIPATIMFSKNERVFFEKAFKFEELENEIKKYLP